MTTTSEKIVTGTVAQTRIVFNKDVLYKIINVTSPILLLLLWEFTVRLGFLDARFFPPPTRVFQTLWEMILTGELFEHLSISLQRIILGFFLGSIPGIVLGLINGWFKPVRAFLEPIIAATYPIPKISLLPLMFVIFGLGEESKVMTVAIAGFFLVFISTSAGVTQIDHIIIQAAENYGAKGWKLFAKVILPATLPAIFTGLRLALGISLLIVVAAEFTATNKGIGYLIWSNWQVLAVNKMYVGLVVIAILGLMFTSGLDRLGRRLMPWAKDIQDRTH